MIRADRAPPVTREALPHLVSPCHAPSLDGRFPKPGIPGRIARLAQTKEIVCRTLIRYGKLHLLKLPYFVSSLEIISMGVKRYDRLPAGPTPIRAFKRKIM